MSLLSDVLVGNIEGVRARLAAGESRSFERDTPIWFGLAERPGIPTGQLTLLHAAAETNQAEVARLLLDQGFDVDARDPNGNTPLHFAARARGVATARVLLAHGADPNAEDCAGYTAIDHAHDYDWMELMLAHGADPNGGPRGAWSTDRYEGWRLIEQLVSFTGDPVVLVRLLLNAGAKVTEHPRALAIAAAREHEGTALLLLERGADPNAALHEVAIASVKLLRVLLEHGAHPDALDASGQTPLAVVVGRGLPRPARLLIEKGADLRVRTPHGTLYDTAKAIYEAGLPDARLVMQLLKEHGAAPSSPSEVVAPASPPRPPTSAAQPVPAAPKRTTQATADIEIGARVVHPKLGAGEVLDVEDGNAPRVLVALESGIEKWMPVASIRRA